MTQDVIVRSGSSNLRPLKTANSPMSPNAATPLFSGEAKMRSTIQDNRNIMTEDQSVMTPVEHYW